MPLRSKRTRFYRADFTPAEAVKPYKDSMPDAPLWGIGFTMWPSDIGSVVEANIGKNYRAAFRAECFLTSQARTGSRLPSRPGRLGQGEL